MTPDELRERCREFVSVNCDSGKVVSGISERLESLCREMIAEGLERAGVRYAEWINGHEFTETPRFEDWCLQEAQRVKGRI